MVRCAGTGKKKIPIKRIEKSSNRKVTFTKRRQGLLKKAEELQILTGCKIAIVGLSTARNPNPYKFGDLSLLELFCNDAPCAGGAGSEGGGSMVGDGGKISSGGGLVTNDDFLSLFYFDDDVDDDSGCCSTSDGLELSNWCESSNLVGGSESCKLVDGYESCDLGESTAVGNLTGGGLNSGGGGELGMLEWSKILNFGVEEDMGLNQLVLIKERLLAAREDVFERLMEAEETDDMLSELWSDDTFFLDV